MPKQGNPIEAAIAARADLNSAYSQSYQIPNFGVKGAIESGKQKDLNKHFSKAVTQNYYVIQSILSALENFFGSLIVMKDNYIYICIDSNLDITDNGTYRFGWDDSTGKRTTEILSSGSWGIVEEDVIGF